LKYIYEDFVYVNRGNKGALYKRDHLIFLGNTWNGILQFLHVTNSAIEVQLMFKNQLEQREKHQYRAQEPLNNKEPSQ